MKEAKTLLERCGRSAVSSSPYDEAWVLRSRSLREEDERELLWNLLSEQKQDGSWGASVFYIHDRVVNTLAVVLALAEREEAPQERERGLEFLRQGIPRLGESEVETIGFELVFPGMLETARALGLELPYECEAVRAAEELGRRKRALIPPGIFVKQTPLSHSLEAFGGYEDAGVFPNGSLGCSPAATAAFLMQRGQREECQRYLRQFQQGGWNVPSIYPFEVFEYAWSLYNFLLAGLLDEVDARPALEALWRHVQAFGGASISDAFPVIDSDDTAMAYIVLKEAGYPVQPSLLEQFEEKSWFRCFQMERNPSISANIHILEAVRRTPDYPRRQEVLDKLLGFLRRTVRADGSWLDKWHISPYYCTAHALLAMGELDDELSARALEYLRRTQREDGGWGICGSSEEETAYALQALVARDTSGAFQGEIEAGVRYMRAGPRPPPELWVDKGLYCPLDVVESACLVWRAGTEEETRSAETIRLASVRRGEQAGSGLAAPADPAAGDAGDDSSARVLGRSSGA
ncbi:MAG TPA: prenyltransferase/squalene oxidase repeat-containing protein [Myxococcaceae bacterium]|nr:prenyltransferase/squalene oxidase repeat-containing protein [Myxococcaceae bacterium]